MAKYLTQEEVDALPEGTQVTITWTGGNGPHNYTIGKFDGQAWTTGEGSDGKLHLGDRIDFVGSEKPFTLVTLTNPSQAARREALPGNQTQETNQ